MGQSESDQDSSFRQARVTLELAGWSVRALHAQLEIAGFGMDAADSAVVPKAFVELERRYVALCKRWQALREAAGANIPVPWRQYVVACNEFRDAELHAYPKLVREEARHASKRISGAGKCDVAVSRARRAMVANSSGVMS